MLMNVIKEPVTHFLLIGVVLFAVYAGLNDDIEPRPFEEIVISEDQAAQLAARFHSTWQRWPTPAEWDGLIDNYVREEILAREAKLLSLDQNDVVIRRRLSQKMEFLTESAASALNPSDEELRNYYEANSEIYRTSPQVAFDQILVGPEPDASEVSRIRERLEAGADPRTFGGGSLLPASLPLSQKPIVDRTFGRGFFDQLAEFEIGEWMAPVRSGYGVHIIRVNERIDGKVPEFEDVRDKVGFDWKSVKSAELASVQFRQIRERYSVSRPDVSTLELPSE